MSRVRSIGAGLALLLIVAAVPVALLVWGVPPTVAARLFRPDDGSALLAVFTLIGWLAWAGFTVSVVVEAVNVVGRRAVPIRLPLLGGLQTVAGALVFAALTPLGAGGAAASDLTGAGAHQAAASGHQAVVSVEPRAVVGTDRATSLGRANQKVATRESQDEAAKVPGYLVRAGDDLWSIAEQMLGDGRLWRRLADANPGLLADPTVDLSPGTRLVLPSDPAADEVHRQAKAHTVTVLRGDTLSGLAKKHLGDTAKWPRIYRANADLIDDPDLIDIGWRLVIPSHGAAHAVPQQTRPPRRPAGTVERDRPELDQPELDRPRIEQPAPTASAPATSATGPASSPVTPMPASPRANPTTTKASPTPTTAVPTQAPADAPEPTPVSTAPSADASDPAWPLIGGLGAAAAAMILTGLGASRLGQLRARPLGRRIAHPPVDVRRYETALGRRERPDSPALLEKALRHLGEHAHTRVAPLPPLQHVLLDDVGIAFHWRSDPGAAPEPFHQVGSAWLLSARAADHLPESHFPVPFPALVTLGRDQAGCWLMVDLESAPPLVLCGPRSLRHAAAAAMAVELSCSPWAAELNLLVVGGDEVFVRAACPELVRFEADPQVAMDLLGAIGHERATDEAPTALLRMDPDRAEAGAAHVVLVADELPERQHAGLAALLDPDLGLSGVLGAAAAGNGWALVLDGPESDPSATLEPGGQPLVPQLVPAHTRAAIGTIFAATDESAHAGAPWWADQASDNVRTLVPRRQADRVSIDEPPAAQPEHPYLQLFGPIELAGAAGPAPARSHRQCVEYCAWLLENPNSTATRMTNELVVAETTRRSNMSRLRSWLGLDRDGRAYLPEAYSGRISLHPEVSSDWQRMQVLTAPGLNRLTAETLVDVLELVRGAPLADAAPGQWRWAEELRTDMSSVARDAGVLLARWAVERRDLDLARWAAARALVAAPEDELLLVERIRTEHAAGNTGEVERLVRWVTSQARVLGVDLAPETVDTCQRVLEGRTRPRAVR